MILIAAIPKRNPQIDNCHRGYAMQEMTSFCYEQIEDRDPMEEQADWKWRGGAARSTVAVWTVTECKLQIWVDCR